MKFALWKYPLHALAVGLGTGLSPIAPGTIGSLLGVAAVWVLAPLGAARYAVITVVLWFAGVFICGVTARDYDAVDPGFIVYDEIVGFLVAMYLLPATWRWLLAGFVIYRIFDIWKPFPIGLVEENLGIGSGIMADDVVAGLYALGILHFARFTIERFGSGLTAP